MIFAKTRTLAIAAILAVALPASAHAVQCANDGSRYNEWKAAFKAEHGNRFKASTWAKFDGTQYSTKVIGSVRNQKSFKLSFDEFYKRRATGLDKKGKAIIKKHASAFAAAEARFGVQPEVIAAIWGLETIFGTYKGQQLPILQSVATLAYDCRRSEFFTNELLAALTIIDDGISDLSKRTGAWAGELGQTQFLPSSYLLAEVDMDGGGVDVWNSPADVIGSTANWLAKKGWQRGAPYGEGTANFRVIQAWNKATVYQKTIAVLASRIAN